MTNMWVGNFGEYQIPSQFKTMRITRRGWPDRRCKQYEDFMRWVMVVDVPHD